MTTCLVRAAPPGCALAARPTTPKTAPRGPDFEVLHGAIQLVVDDPAEDLLYVKMGGKISVLSADGRTDPLPSAPPLKDVPDGALATIDPSRGLRLFDPERGWLRVTSSGKAPLGGPWQVPMPRFSVVEGVLVEVPLAGPDQGRPRPRCVLDTALPSDAVLWGRDELVLFAGKSGAGFVEPVTCDVLPVGAPGYVPLAVRPGLALDGTHAAFAFKKESAAARGSKFVVVLTTQRGLVDTLSLAREPLSIRFGAGALYVEVPNDTGGRQFMRHVPASAIPFEPSARDRALKRHADGLRIRVREAMDENALIDAVDHLDLLRSDGLVDQLTAEDAALTQEVVQKARPLLADAAKRALSDGETSLAAVIDRRAAVLLGKTVLEHAPSLPSLQLGLTTAPSAQVDVALVAAVYKRGEWIRHVETCKPKSERGSGIPCLDLRLDAGALPADTTVRNVAAEFARKRQTCVDDGAVNVEDGPAGPRSAWTCDVTNTALPTLDTFRALLARRLQKPIVVSATFDDGQAERFELPRVAGLDDATAAVELALLVQTTRDRQLALLAARDNESTAEAARLALRMLAFRLAPYADDDVRRAVAGDGTVRTGWLRAR